MRIMCSLTATSLLDTAKPTRRLEFSEATGACTRCLRPMVTSSLVIIGVIRSYGGRGKPHRGRVSSSESTPSSVGSIPWSAAAQHSNLVVRRRREVDWKRIRGGRESNGRAGKPQRGKRSREHRLRRVVTHAAWVRTLSRSKTLKSRVLACRRLLRSDFRRTWYCLDGRCASTPLRGLRPLVELAHPVSAEWTTRLMLKGTVEVVQ